ncbi:hypothetical protein, partial [[Eubacterium] cellulosolvens]
MTRKKSKLKIFSIVRMFFLIFFINPVTSNALGVQAQETENYLLTGDEVKEYFPEWTLRVEEDNPIIFYFIRQVRYQQANSTEPKEWTIGFKFLEHIIDTEGGVHRDYYKAMVVEMADRPDSEERIWDYSSIGDIGYLCLGMSEQLGPVYECWKCPCVTFIELEFLKGDWFVKFKLESHGGSVDGINYYPCNIRDLVEPTLDLAKIVEAKLN